MVRFALILIMFALSAFFPVNLVHGQASTPGTLRLISSSQTISAGNPFTVRLLANVADNNLNIAFVKLSFDPATLAMTGCKPSQGYQGIFGGAPCVTADGSVAIKLETVNPEGSKGEVELVAFTFRPNTDGPSTISIANGAQIIVQNAAGRSTEYPVDISSGGSITLSGQQVSPTTTAQGTGGTGTSSISVMLSNILNFLKSIGLF